MHKTGAQGDGHTATTTWTVVADAVTWLSFTSTLTCPVLYPCRISRPECASARYLRFSFHTAHFFPFRSSSGRLCVLVPCKRDIEDTGAGLGLHRACCEESFYYMAIGIPDTAHSFSSLHYFLTFPSPPFELQKSSPIPFFRLLTPGCTQGLFFGPARTTTPYPCANRPVKQKERSVVQRRPGF